MTNYSSQNGVEPPVEPLYTNIHCLPLLYVHEQINSCGAVRNLPSISSSATKIEDRQCVAVPFEMRAAGVYAVGAYIYSHLAFEVVLTQEHLETSKNTTEARDK